MIAISYNLNNTGVREVRAAGPHILIWDEGMEVAHDDGGETKIVIGKGTVDVAYIEVSASKDEP